MTMRMLLIAASILALAGCGGPPPDSPVNVANAVMAEPPPSLKLGDFELNQRIRVSGARPDWSLDMGPGQMLFTDLSVDPPAPKPFYWVAPVVEDAVATYTTQRAGGDAVVLKLTRRDCREAGETLPLTAVLSVAGKIRRGCAGPKPVDVPPEPADNATAP